ncbi:MAG: hypothetical protein FWH22_01715 [Fibromonadales bacterium]|nr:hypothetical protein [Fibromonadales bacterium]
MSKRRYIPKLCLISLMLILASVSIVGCLDDEQATENIGERIRKKVAKILPKFNNDKKLEIYKQFIEDQVRGEYESKIFRLNETIDSLNKRLKIAEKRNEQLDNRVYEPSKSCSAVCATTFSASHYGHTVNSGNIDNQEPFEELSLSLDVSVEDLRKKIEIQCSTKHDMKKRCIGMGKHIFVTRFSNEELTVTFSR